MPQGNLVQPGSLMAGGADGWKQPILNAGGGGGPCSPGTDAYSLVTGETPVYGISSNTIPQGSGTPDTTWQEFFIGDLLCDNYRLTINLDLAWAYLAGGAPQGGNARAYLSPSGAPDISTFTGTSILQMQAGNGLAPSTLVPIDGAFYNRTWRLLNTTQAYADFAGPQVSMSLYFWGFITFPSLIENGWFLKNIHADIVVL